MEHTFDTTLYEKKYGQEPRGKRVWEFVPADHIWRDYLQPVNGVKWTGTFSEAKSVVAQRYPKMKEWKVLA
jgi:hypothetical protein